MNNLSDNLVLQTYYHLPVKYREEALNFMQFLLTKYEQEESSKNYSEVKQKRQFGYFPKGTFVMSDDFDAPLDCFKEYM